VLVSVEKISEDPSRRVEINVFGTLNVLEVAGRLDIEKLVYTSSATVYGDPLRSL